MAGRSEIARNPALRTAVDDALQRGCTLDAIVEHVRSLGLETSRSAVGRYSKDYAALAAEQRNMRAMADAFAADFGDAENHQGRLAIQLLTSIATRLLIPMAGGEEPQIDGKDLHFFARAVKDITSAAKTDADREQKIRDQAEKTAREKAAADGADALRSAGASEESIALMRAKILGIGQ